VTDPSRVRGEQIEFNSGNDTITGTWQNNTTATQAIAVSNQNFIITAPTANTSILVTTQTQPITVAWTASGVSQTGTVDFTSSRGTLSAQSVGITNGALNTPVTISSTTAGPAIISATALDGTGTAVATAQVTVNFIATVPNTVSLQASPSSVPVQGQSTITATVLDPTGNHVQGATVGFTIRDPTGGSLSASDAVTNAQGEATVSYTASTTSSAPNGVVVTAVVVGTNISSTTPLTVGGQTVFLSLGTGNTISAYSSTQYEMPFTVTAVDAAGHGVGGVISTFSVQSVSYNMGAMSVFHQPPGSWLNPEYTAINCSPTNVTEYNGVINPSPPPANVTGVSTAIPGSVASTDVGSATTTSAGTAPVNVIYPKDHAYWVTVALTATATVQGTQNSTTAIFLLPGLAGDYTTQTVSPPGQVSPYGQAATCY